MSWEHAQQLLAEAVQEGGQPPPAVAAHPGPGGAQPDPEHPLSGFYRRVSAVVADGAICALRDATEPSRVLQQGTYLSPSQSH